MPSRTPATSSPPELPADLLTPLGAYLRLSENAGGSFLLESVERGRLGRYSFVGAGSRLVSFEQAETLGEPVVGYLGYDAVATFEPTVQLPEDGPDAMRQRARDRDYAFAYVHDASQEVARAYGAERTPEVFLFDSGGRLAYHGAIDDAWEEENVTAHYLTDAIELIRHGGLVQPAETPPVGCSIKWRDS